ncbi:Myeloid differentiation primary response protein MyD88 [Eumeta japonica]|uniref:Myeloid differentiation primary response protein MyD88 n=1 Tax=Eumeta variegata TaxID=151549 RepID=A0A4C1W0G8_EUMVA|nr:Myeloid differentiation primary response protein MyD88 [Eumeta japonica]
MIEDINLNDTPLTGLSFKSRSVLSTLLNPQKVFPSSQDKLPRDWRGLAAQINLPLELHSSIRACEDKTAKLLEIWVQKRDGTATFGQLLKYLEKLDRHDIVDDLKEISAQGLLIGNVPAQQIQSIKPLPMLEELRDDLITIDDVRLGEPEWYHAYVLYATEDKEFVDELLQRMRNEGFKLCTEDDLIPGFTTQYGPVSRLISERCYKIILIYSPDFLRSPANTFYMDYAQAVGIESKRSKIIPCMYRDCQLPTHLTFYHKLRYQPHARLGYDFWMLLSNSLRTTVATSAEIKFANGHIAANTETVPDTPKKSFSINNLSDLQVSKEDSKFFSTDLSPLKSKQTRPNKIKKFFTRTFGNKKLKEKPVMVENS